MLIDTHCHLASFVERGDFPAVLDRAAAAGVSRVITIGTSPDDWNLYAGLAAAHPGKVDYTVGLHPCDLPNDDSWQGQVALIPAFFQCTPRDGPRPVAIGEIGLDRYHLPKDSAAAEAIYIRQQAAFRAQLSIARELDCPIVIHSRNSFADCVRLMDESRVNWQRVVFHCFAYGPDEIRLLNARGGRGSFTGIITYKNADPVRAAVLAQGIETLLLETDAPYLAPIPHRGKPNEPAYLAETARDVAGILNISESELATRTSSSAAEFFRLK